MTLLELLSSVVITIVPLGGDLGNGDICGGDIGGIYMEGKIYVCESGENTEFYKQHELMHYIWDKKLTDNQKKQYTILYNMHHKLGIKAFYREYGFNDLEEDFCDNGGLLFTKENSNPYVMKRVKFIKNIIQNISK